MDAVGAVADAADVLSGSRYFVVALLVPVSILCAGIPVGLSAAATTEYARAITNVCSGAVLFERSHSLGTRAGALAVARDIRASARHRLDRVAAVPVPRTREALVERWIALERRLADVHAESWIGIFDAIDAADTHASATVYRRL